MKTSSESSWKTSADTHKKIPTTLAVDKTPNKIDAKIEGLCSVHCV